MERHGKTTSQIHSINTEVPEYQIAFLSAISPLSVAVEEYREPDRHTIFRWQQRGGKQAENSAPGNYFASSFIMSSQA